MSIPRQCTGCDGSSFTILRRSAKMLEIPGCNEPYFEAGTGEPWLVECLGCGLRYYREHWRWAVSQFWTEHPNPTGRTPKRAVAGAWRFRCGGPAAWGG